MNMMSEKQHTNSILTINNMPNLQSGAKYKVAPEHHGRHAHPSGVFSINKRHQQEELLSLGQVGQLASKLVKLMSIKKG
jgi:hypothetical protein